MYDGWSVFIEWPLSRDLLAVPPMVRPGDIIKSDLQVRLEFIGKRFSPNEMALFPVKDHIWTVIDGESFMITPPPPVQSYGLVTHGFRIWLGEGSPFEKTEERAKGGDRPNTYVEAMRRHYERSQK